jgi:flagellar biosynthesis protein FlhF
MQEMEAMRRELREMRSELASRHLESLRTVPDEFREVAGVLLDRGLALEQTVDVVAQVALECPPGERTPEGIRAAVRLYLAKRLPVANLLELKGRRPKIVLFLGPTGVGKSTTIAKVAARCLLDEKLQPAILSTDSYRMGAMEQMTAFAQAAGILFETVFRPEDADSAMERLQEADLVLVDTAGRARGHQEHLVELRELVRRLMPDEIHLVVAAGMRERDLADTYDRFAPLGVDHLVFTKLDETLEPGALFALPVRKGVPISLICDGQAIPDDLHIANADALAAMILGVPT